MGHVREQRHPRDGGKQSGRKEKNKAEIFWEVEMTRWADGLDGKTKGREF